MALDFPSSPTVGQIFPSPAQAGVPQWKWDGAEWVPYSSFLTANMQMKRRVFTSTQAYVPTPGLMFADVECKGGGGGGGGLNSVNATQSNGAGGGADGTYSRILLTAAQIGAGQTITIGAGGAAGTGSPVVNGGTGGTTSFGSLCTAPGGGGALSMNTSSSPTPGLAGAVGVGDYSIQGSDGGTGFWYNAAAITSFGGHGGGSQFSSLKSQAGGAASSGANGGTGHNYGGGGTGGSVMGVTGPVNGGAGQPGVCVVTEYGNFGQIVIPSGYVQRGMLAGLTMSTAGSSTTMTVAPGQCADANAGDYMSLAASMSKTTAAWAAGSGNGGLDTGSIAATTWYYWFVIKNPTTGAVDVLFSLSPSAPTLPSGYTLARRIGAMNTNASSQWASFIQRGDEFHISAPVINVNNVNPGTTPTLYAVGTPTGISVMAMMQVAFANTVISQAVYIWSPLVGAAGKPALYTLMNNVAAATPLVACFAMYRTNTLGQIYAACLGAATNSVYMSTFGWIDDRDRTS